ncbi:hypothetical protein HG535_0G00840 [Zygotorulaspora mrakii]|uniref:Mitochondrial import receptor subunit TOM22 n=1 Tax=Zygotorulaspora mrakii TaxID=42260 RepID=A0A7H9B6P3_ZYGMR|nr:uncharacterized protein HG535_0G00840 [Zygotorulaspora mrakii]QLG74200.1 hypothetical protein HG535_0G00840 [Zygotorulaspora mrakii]
MVELTEIIEGSNSFEEEQVQAAFEEGKAGDLSDDEYDSDFDDDDFDENETILERIVALKDMVPPKQRQTITNFVSSTTNFLRTAFSKTGSITWALATSAMLLGVPLSLSILGEQQLIEMEKSFDLQKDANDILAQGDNGAAVTPPATTAA